MRFLSGLGLLLAAFAVAWWRLPGFFSSPQDTTAGHRPDAVRLLPVETAAIERGAIEHRRTFTGTLEAHAELVVASKIAGRIAELRVDLADPVQRGQVVIRLDNDEPLQEVAQAEAELTVARANLAEAESLLTIAEREWERIDQLRERGVSSESQRDTAKADQLAKQAHVAITQAQVARAQAVLAGARIRLGETEIAANWRGGRAQRVVAERHIQEGETVAANAPLLRIVELDPIKAVCFVAERDYARLAPGQVAEIRTDAFGEGFSGRITRIAPVFQQTTRQARVELTVDNPDRRLKPGMFVQATIVLERLAEAVIVPEPALTARDGQPGVFVLNASADRVAWRPITPGVRQDGRVQILGEGLSGRVVTLGQPWLEDGSQVSDATAD